ncbi:putative lipid-transfer protein DIR1 [Mangifera indica]|uniref:putative lipid-transfer protein DIR1 n=1 Tax=Mangifera indica TaxID=29780 RepID=UPI001CFA1FA9|nr:putative lipid-transfer protein DIR1 [Mangifera indica]
MEAYTKFVIVAVVLGLAIRSEAFGMEKKSNTEGICGMTREGLMMCKPFVNIQSTVPPSLDCCSALSKANLPCFCMFKNSGLLGFYGIDFNQAMQLPTKCNLPNTSHC